MKVDIVLGGVGDMSIQATTGRGHSAEELADMAMKRIMVVSATAPEPIRDQAVAYQDKVRALLVHYFKQTKRSGITDIYNILRDHGQHEAAEIVAKLNRGD